MPPTDALRALVQDRLGLATPPQLAVRFASAIEESARVLGEPVSALLPVLASSALESKAWQALIDVLTIRETNFFRHRAWFDQLERLIAEIAERKRRAGSRRLTIWSAACATGEEAYSLAIAVDRLLPDRQGWEIGIVATDVHARSLRQAQRAIYSEWSMREVGPAERTRYFTQIAPKRYRVIEAVRGMVEFRALNLAEARLDWNGSTNFDLIVCRNVLMHFAPAQQKEAAQRLTRALDDDGWIAVTPAEAVAEWFAPLSPVSAPEAIFFRFDAMKPAKQVQQVSTGGTAPSPARRRARIVAASRRAPVPAATPRESSVERARALANGGDLIAARQHCEVVLREDRLSFEGNLLLALVCAEMDDATAALAAASSAAYLRPDSAPAHFMRAKALLRLGHAGRARRVMDSLMKLLDSNPESAMGEWGLTAETLRAMLNRG